MRKVETVWVPPLGERIVGVTTWRDQVYVATEFGVYRVRDDGEGVDVVPFSLKTGEVTL